MVLKVNMPIQLVNEDLRKNFVEISRELKLAEPLRTTETKQGIIVPILHLDKLWHFHKYWKPVIDLVVESIKTCETFKIDSCDMIVGITSSLATYGPIPLLGNISSIMGKNLIIANESFLGEYLIYPSHITGSGLRHKKFLLIKDGLLKGSSITKVVGQINSYGGEVGGIFTFVDIDNLSPSAEAIIQQYVTIEILNGKLLNLVMNE